MTATQLALGDCDPAWEPLSHPSVERRRTPARRPHRDLVDQLLTRTRKRRITDVPLVGEYL